MEDLCICKICKKVFTDVQGLNKHKMAQHPQKQQSNNINSSRDIIAHQFRNNSNISITKIRKETNNSVISQSAMNQNQNSFLKAKGTASPSITVRRQEMKMKQQGEGARVRGAFRGPAVRIKQPASSITVMGRSGVEVDDDTTDWQKWEPPLSKDRESGPNNHVVPPGNPSRAGGAIISKSAAEMASSAFINAPSNSTTARKSVPHLLPMLLPQNGGQTGGKRPAPSVKVSSTSQKLPSARNSISDIMQNLGKMKALNRPAAAPNPKLISIPSSQTKKGPPPVAAVPPSPKMQAPQKQQANPPFRVTKPPQVSKSKAKILPRNALNNALPKPGGAVGKGSKTIEPIEDMEDDSSDQQEDEEEKEPELFIPQPPEKPLAKKSAPSLTKTGAKSGAGGKIASQKSINSNRFNPIGSPNKKVKGKPDTFSATSSSAKVSPNGKSNGANKQSSSSAAAVVGKKSNPPPAKKQKSSEATLKKLKAYAPTMPGTDYEMPKLTSIGSYTNRLGQQVWVCLVCNEKEQEESSRDMICCEMCEDWYHWECVGIRQAMEEQDPWYCKRCIYQTAHNPKKDFPKLFKNDVFDV